MDEEKLFHEVVKRRDLYNPSSKYCKEFNKKETIQREISRVLVAVVAAQHDSATVKLIYFRLSLKLFFDRSVG